MSPIIGADPRLKAINPLRQRSERRSDLSALLWTHGTTMFRSGQPLRCTKAATSVQYRQETATRAGVRMEPARSWTGREAVALRKALRMTVGRFASELAVSPRAVANWAQHPDMVPRTAVQDALDDLLMHAPARVRAQFEQTADPRTDSLTQALRVAIAVVVHHGRVLLVRRREDSSGIAWQFPAGIIKPGERAEDVAVREALAETGVHCAVKEPVGHRIHPVTGVQCEYFRCEYLAGEAENRDSVENAGVVWAPCDSVTKFVPRESIYEPVLLILEETRAA